MSSARDNSRDEALVETLRQLLRIYRTPFGLTLWNGVDLAPGVGEGAARVRIADKGALAALLRKPSLDSFVRLHIEGRIDWPNATLFDIEDFSRKTQLKNVLRDIGAGPLLRAGADLLMTPGRIERARGAGDEARRMRGDAVTNASNIRHHYDVSNAFYQLFLDPEMVYTCAYFTPELHDDLAKAQRDKLNLVCRKLRLKPGQRLLDIGCGWGAMIRHAARHYGATCVGVTLSQEQAAFARERIAAEGLSDRCTVLLADYRELDGELFDAACSIGMFEHVALEQHAEYFKAINARLKPGGLYLHHAIARKSLGEDRQFRRMGPEYQAIVRYIFPGGELDHLGRTITNLERNRFEVHDVEALRLHYMRTTQLWHDRLLARRAEAEREVGEETTRLWLLYLAAVSIGFRRHWVGVFQTLVSKRDLGRHALPVTRADLFDRDADLI